MSKPITIIIAGAGGRGQTYASYAADYPNEAQVVGVAEPIEFRRELMRTKYNIPARHVFTDWADMAKKRRFADAVVIGTQDAMHAGPAVAFARKGYAVLLEKPMAPTAAECKRIVRTAVAKDVIFAVCHVMRYTGYTRKLKQVLDSGAIGEIVSVEHLEPVGYWHQAHAFVRGKWRNTAESSFMLLAKSCHDVDWLRYIVGAPCKAVSSFGSLKHFRKECAPVGAADRCLDCPVEPTCCYSAKKIYLGRIAKGHTGWPVNIIDGPITMETVTEALRTGPYGRCVYHCDNDVVDHQTVNFLYGEDRTAVFTMTAFNQAGHRRTRIFGTKGSLYSDGVTLEVTDFLTDAVTRIDTNTSDATILGGHGGGDFGIMQAFVSAVSTGDRSKILSGPTESLETHLTVFAAEKARLTGKVVSL